MQAGADPNIEVIREQYLAMDKCERASLEAVVGQKYVSSKPYYSGVQFHATRSIFGGGFAYTVAQGTVVRAFSYGFNQAAVSAGFPAGVLATAADTNIVNPGETIGNEEVQISGLAGQVLPGCPDATTPGSNDLFTDPRLLMQIMSAASVELSLGGGQNLYKLGVLGMMPGAGGLTGQGIDAVGEQSLDGVRPLTGQVTNGWPTVANAFQMPEGLVWRSPGTNVDSLLEIVITPRRQCRVFSGGFVDNIFGDEGAGAGVRGYTFPIELAVALMIHLQGAVVGGRSWAT